MMSLGKWTFGSLNLGVVGTFVVALYLPLIVGVGGIDPRQFFVVTIIVLLAGSYGRFVTRVINLHKVHLPSDGLQFVTGILVLSLLLLGLTEFFYIGALASATLCAAGAFLLSALRKRIATDPKADQGEFFSEPVDLLTVLFISVIVCVWSREALSAVRVAQDTGVFRAWSDFFLFASEIRYLELFPSFRGESMYLSGVPQIFYHRASFSVSGLFSAASATPPLETAMYFWMPTGIVLLGISTYLFGCALAGRGAGILSVAMLFLTPDPAMYWTNNSLFSFHWLIQVAPGTGYALSSVLIGFSFLIIGIREKLFRLIAIAVGFVIAAAAFRVHIAIPAGLCLGLILLLTWPTREKWHRAIGLLIAALTAIVMIFAFEQIPLAPHFLTGKRDGLKYVEIILGVLPWGYTEIRQLWGGMENTVAKNLLGYLAIIPLELGVFFPLLMVFPIIAIWVPVLRGALLLPFLLLIIHGAITIFMPTPAHSDISEWTHRSFPLLYTVVVVFVASCTWQLLKRLPNVSQIERFGPKKIALLTICTCCLIFVPWYYGKRIQQGFIGGGEVATSTKIPSELFSISKYIQITSKPGDVFAFSTDDPLAVMVSITGLQAYVSREAFFVNFPEGHRILVQRRISIKKDIKVLGDLLRFGSESRVRWYILRRQDNVNLYDNLLPFAGFVENEIAVVDINKVRDGYQS